MTRAERTISSRLGRPYTSFPWKCLQAGSLPARSKMHMGLRRSCRRAALACRCRVKVGGAGRAIEPGPQRLEHAWAGIKLSGIDEDAVVPSVSRIHVRHEELGQG